ncbi:sigma-70 family RNA polymerase sigma factor [uncultured Draconibacterium sp.]|uniref:RNA polymerase sigma factor n=1 Tax=uncultured Draconibacterium sp. TaxID=1573823 RepID=UPI0029C99883|nr:sigma-70 family RNA polymerase sigma factor [uncultured Draconibacterium sp.]
MGSNKSENIYSEDDLIRRILKGDNEAFSLIYDRYANELLSYGVGLGFDKETLKDTIQDIFARIYDNPNYLKDIRNLKAYFFRSLKNQLINIRKAQTDVVEISKRELEFSVSVTVLDELIEDEDRLYLKTEVEKYLNCLTSRQREAIYLRFIQELSYDEIATLLNLSPHAARKLTSRAILRIRKENIPVIMLFASLYSSQL